MTRVLASLLLLLVPHSALAHVYPAEATLFGQEVDRSGFHFQLSFGVGGGPDTAGLFHAMEIGGTVTPGVTIALLHTFIQNKGVIGGNQTGPDLIGGWMLEVKFPVYFPELVAKAAIGIGGAHDQSDGIRGIPGPAIAYGLDFHLPLHRDGGLTLGVTGMNVHARGSPHFGIGIGLGYTLF
jgi:hypothetical protein